jgi:toxin ParE1/3/4
MPLITKKPGVELDLGEIFDFIAQDKLEPAERFLKVAADSIERLAAMPGLGRKWESALPLLREVRVFPMPAPFRNYLIFYRPITGGIDVLCVLHGARDLESVLRRRT